MTPTVMFMTITLSALSAPSVTYIGQNQRWQSKEACEQALPKAEKIIERIVSIDPTALLLFGYVAGVPTRAHFVSDGECNFASDLP